MPSTVIKYPSCYKHTADFIWIALVSLYHFVTKEWYLHPLMWASIKDKSVTEGGEQVDCAPHKSATVPTYLFHRILPQSPVCNHKCNFAIHQRRLHHFDREPKHSDSHLRLDIGNKRCTSIQLNVTYLLVFIYLFLFHFFPLVIQ